MGGPGGAGFAIIERKTGGTERTDHAGNLWQDVERIRAQAPLVHNITNFVVMNTTANALLALGASPVMAHAVEEARAMAGLASALVLNIGTLSPPWIAAMLEAGQEANRRASRLFSIPSGQGPRRSAPRPSRSCWERCGWR